MAQWSNNNSLADSKALLKKIPVKGWTEATGPHESYLSFSIDYVLT